MALSRLKAKGAARLIEAGIVTFPGWIAMETLTTASTPTRAKAPRAGDAERWTAMRMDDKEPAVEANAVTEPISRRRQRPALGLRRAA